MIKKAFAGLIAGSLALAVLPAGATDWGKQIDLCATALEAEGLATVSDYDVKFAGGTAKRLIIKLIPADGGEPLIAECKISRGNVKEVKLKA